MKRTVILLILDGWGVGRNDRTNPIYVAGTPNLSFLREKYPNGLLQASGIAVGLPWSEEGNSEVGHLTIGAGRTVWQYFPRITQAIKDASFFTNDAIAGAMRHVATRNGTAHLVMLLSEGHVHASLEHLNATIELAKKENVQDVRIHAISDGKDSAPHSIISLLKKIPWSETVRLASLSGRYYAMDRDRHFDRTAAAYAAITGTARLMPDAESHIQKSYARDLTDEFIEPVCIGDEPRRITENDAVIFCNFREDGMRQLAAPFSGTYPIDAPALAPLPNKIYTATMTAYETASQAHVAFSPQNIINTLGDVLAANGKSQMRIAETEKYAHVTYFFNGLRNDPLAGEYRVLIPSENIARHDDKPEMMTAEITSRAITAIEEGIDFMLVNFAAPDVIAHTGNFEAALRAIRAADREAGTIAQAALARGACCIITADHGNAEQMRDPVTGMPETQHDANPVPVILIAKELERPRAAINATEIAGVLADIAPTILELMNIPKPVEMTGESLVGRIA